MAQRRMFSPDIVTSDAFLEMPISTQALYFQLGMRADDDGFVNPRVTMRLIGTTEDDLKVLIGKRFVLPFENGVVVVKHWRINNFIRKDRYKETVYLKEKSKLRVRDNQSYTLNVDDTSYPISEVDWKSDEQVRRLSSGQPTVNHRSTQDRLGKVRLGKEEVANAPAFEDEIKAKSESYRALIRDIASHDYLSAEKIHAIVLVEFLPHWLEKSANGKKALWQKQKTFDYQLRIRTWIRNYHGFKKDVQCKAQNWHVRGETCHCTPKVEVQRKVFTVDEKRAIKGVADAMRITEN